MLHIYKLFFFLNYKHLKKVLQMHLSFS